MMKRLTLILMALLLVAGVATVSAAGEPPSSSFTASKTVFDGGVGTGDVNFISTSTGNISNYVWYIDGYVVGFGEILSISYPWVDVPEAHAVVLRTFGNDTYADSKPLAIIVNPMPTTQPTPNCTPPPEPTLTPTVTPATPTRESAGVFRPSNGNWYFNTDNAGTVSASFHFGSSQDIPVAGDFNGDGITDTAVFRPSNGNWYVYNGADGFMYIAVHFGTSGDIPIAADFGIDGIDDFVIFRPSNGNWYIDANHDGVTDLSFHFGTPGDTPLTGRWSA